MKLLSKPLDILNSQATAEAQLGQRSQVKSTGSCLCLKPLAQVPFSASELSAGHVYKEEMSLNSRNRAGSEERLPPKHLSSKEHKDLHNSMQGRLLSPEQLTQEHLWEAANLPGRGSSKGEETSREERLPSSED